MYDERYETRAMINKAAFENLQAIVRDLRGQLKETQDALGNALRKYHRACKIIAKFCNDDCEKLINYFLEYEEED